MSPVFDNILPCLPMPQSLRQKLYCGVPHDRVDEFTEPIEIEPTEQVPILIHSKGRSQKSRGNNEVTSLPKKILSTEIPRNLDPIALIII